MKEYKIVVDTGNPNEEFLQSRLNKAALEYWELKFVVVEPDHDILYIMERLKSDD